MSLGILLDMAASGQGDRVALGRADDGITFARLAELAAGGGAVIAAQPVGHVVMLGRNGPLMPHLLFAAAHAGLPFTPMNYRLPADQLTELLGDLDRPFIVADEDYLTVVKQTGHPVMSTTEFVTAAQSTTPTEAVYVDDSAPAVMLFTSGTTSKPKIVPLRHENLVSYILGTVEFSSAAEDDAALVTVPPYHVAAIGSVLSNLYSGRRVVYLPDFSAEGWLALVAEENVTTAMVVPTMLSRVVEHLAGAVANAPKLRLISYGGARMPQPVLERALAAFPNVGFVNAYGLTETSSTIALLGPDDHRAALAATDPKERARLGSAGKPVPGVEMQVRDDDGTVLGPDEVGELWVRGPQVSGEYVGVGSVLDADGWFPTKDRAWLDAEGYLFIEGRSDDTIIRGGENIAPAEIEDALVSHPAVLDAAVIGIDDDEWGQRLVAVVVRREGFATDADELKSYVRGQLRGSRTPDAIVWRTELPHTPTGKLLRREVVADVNAELAALTS